MLLDVDIYKKQEYLFPLDEENKEAKYFLRAAKSMYSQYVRNECVIPYNWEGRRSIRELRDHGKGKMDINQFKQMLYSAALLKKNIEVNWSNISWDIVQIYPKFRDILKGMLMRINFDVDINAIDSDSMMEKEMQVALIKLYSKPEWKMINDQIAGDLGINPNPNNVPVFDTEDEIELYRDAGGVKLMQEIEMYKLLKTSMYKSGWDTIYEKLIEDAIDLGMFAVEDYTDTNMKEARVRYVDVANLVIRQSDYNDFRDADYAGVFEEMTINELRKVSDLTDAQLMAIAKKYMGVNPQYRSRVSSYGVYNTSYYKDYYNKYGVSPIDDVRVMVLRGYFIASDIEYYTCVERQDGTLVYNKVDKYYKLTKKEEKKGKRLEQKRVHRLYKFKWIVGTDYVFDYGAAEDMVYDGTKGAMEVRLPITLYKISGSSIGERCIAFSKDIQLATLRWRNAKAKMPPPPRMVIYKDVLENITLGGVSFTPLEIKELFQSDGYLIVQTRGDFGEPTVGAGGRPVDYLPSGLAEDFQIFMQDVEYNINQIRQVTGINEVSEGQAKASMKVGVAQALQMSTNNATFHLVKGLQTLMSEMYRKLSVRWQSIVRNVDVKTFFYEFGKPTIDIIKQTSKIPFTEFGLQIKAMPNEEEKMFLFQELAKMREMRMKQGAGGLDVSDYFFIYNIIKTGNLKLAQLMLIKLAAQRRKEDIEMAQKNSEMNAKIMQQSKQMDMQRELLKEKAREEREMNVLEAERLIEKEKDERRYEMEIAKSVINRGLDLQQEKERMANTKQELLNLLNEIDELVKRQQILEGDTVPLRQKIQEMNARLQQGGQQGAPQGAHPEGMPPQGMPPEGMPPEGMPPEMGQPQGGQPQGMPPEGENINI